MNSGKFMAINLWWPELRLYINRTDRVAYLLLLVRVQSLLSSCHCFGWNTKFLVTCDL